MNGFKQLTDKLINAFGSNNFRKGIIIKQHDLTDCGAACLASVAANFGLKIPIAQIRQYASTDKKGTNLLGLIEAANRLNMSAKAIRIPAESIFELPFPSVAHVVINKKLEHYVVIYGADKNGIRVMDPAKGTMETIPVAEFNKISTGIILLLAPDADFEKKDRDIPVSSRFAHLLLPHKSILLQILLGALVYTLLGLATSIYLQKIVDVVLPGGNKNLLNLMSVVMIGILLVQLFINYLKTVLTIRTGQQIDARLILGYYKHLLRLPQQFFDSMRTGEIISRMNDAVKIRLFLNDVLITLAVNVFIVIFSFAMMFTSSWKLGLIMFTVVPLYSIIYYFSNRINKRTQRRLMEDTADLQSQLVESVNAIGTIKRFGLEEYANIKTESRFVKLLGTVYNSALNSLGIGNSSSFVSGLFTIILLWAGSSFVLNNQLSPGELLSFYALVGYFTGPVTGLIGMNKTMQDAMIAADRLFQIMDLEKESYENKVTLTRDMIGDISIRDLHFRYGSRTTVFEGLDLDIKHGAVTAVVGESGSGKTTLLSLLQNIYPPTSGSIHIGAYDIKYLSPDSLRSLVGVVPQQVDLFASSVIENIAVGDFNPDMKKVLTVCQQLGLQDFIEKLPNGFNTYLGENGSNLSGGQRQRLAIARAFYKDPEILILDEATSSLDSLSEQTIQQAIQQFAAKGKTVIIIAHRLSTVMNADNIIVLEKGILKESGTHQELLKAKATYYNMWMQQFPLLEKKKTRAIV